MVKLIPHDTFVVQVPAPLSTVKERLQERVEAPRMFWRERTPFAGTVSETGFTVRRVLNYRNSFAPHIQGRFEATAQATTVRVSMGFHPVIWAFLGFWYFTWYGVALLFFISGEMSSAMAALFLGLPALMLVIFWGAFWYEVDRSRLQLTAILLGQYVPPKPRSRLKRRLFIGYLLVASTALTVWMGGRPDTPSTQIPAVPGSVATLQTSNSSVACLTKVQTIAGHPSVNAIALSQDGQLLVSGGSDKALKVWDLQTGELLRTLQSDSGRMDAVAISPDNKTVVSGSGDRMVRIWDLAAERPPKMLRGHTADVRGVSITPDGKTIISTSYGAVKLWDLATGELRATLPNPPQTVTQIGPLSLVDDSPSRFIPEAIDAENNTAIFNRFGKVLVWDLLENREIVKLKRIGGRLLAARLSPNGGLAAVQYASNWQKFDTQVKVFDLSTGEAIAQGILATSSQPYAFEIPLAISRDRMYGSANGRVQIWNLRTAQLEASLDSEWMHGLVVHSDGKLLAGIQGTPGTTGAIAAFRCETTP